MPSLTYPRSCKQQSPGSDPMVCCSVGFRSGCGEVNQLSGVGRGVFAYSSCIAKQNQVQSTCCLPGSHLSPRRMVVQACPRPLGPGKWSLTCALLQKGASAEPWRPREVTFSHSHKSFLRAGALASLAIFFPILSTSPSHTQFNTFFLFLSTHVIFANFMVHFFVQILLASWFMVL